MRVPFANVYVENKKKPTACLSYAFAAIALTTGSSLCHHRIKQGTYENQPVSWEQVTCLVSPTNQPQNHLTHT